MELIAQTVVSEICAHRDAALKAMQQALETRSQSFTEASAAHEYATKAHAGAYFHEENSHDRELFDGLLGSVDIDRCMDIYRKGLDARVWMHLLSRTGLDNLMDKAAKDEFRKTLATNVPVVSEDSVYLTLDNFRSNAALIFRRGLANVFSRLDRRFKSHDGFKIGSRIILTGAFNEWGSWNYHLGVQDMLMDIERSFQILDKQPLDLGATVEAITKCRKGAFSPCQSYTETAYFRIRTFKNGNAHLWFTRPDLVEKANKELAAYYGEVLPDGVPRPDFHSVSGLPSKKLQFYPTPKAVISCLLRDIYITDTSRVLEPSAGTGAIVEALLATKAAEVTALEIDPSRVDELRRFKDPRLNVRRANFLTSTPTGDYQFVIMNPPFYGTHWMEHVVHAYDFLAPGGTLKAILPVTMTLGTSKKHQAFRAWSEARQESYYSGVSDLPPESFVESGTRINTVILTLER